MFIFESTSQGEEGEGERERERERESKAGSSLQAVSTEPDTGLEPTNQRS